MVYKSRAGAFPTQIGYFYEVSFCFMAMDIDVLSRSLGMRRKLSMASAG